MTEIVRINLENEMDLILAHKRTIKIAELCGLSSGAQTTFATSVSEIARCAITNGVDAHLILGINSLRLNKKEIVASIFDTTDLSVENPEAFTYARKLMGELHFSKSKEFFEFRLNYAIPFSGTISNAKISSFRDYFVNEPPISPYDEIRKKNILLINLANKLKESEAQYKVLTDTLPLMIFALNSRGELNYSNKWLKDFFGSELSSKSTMPWQSIIHKDDVKTIIKLWETEQTNKSTFRAEGRMLDRDGNYVWHMITIVPLIHENETQNWIGFFVDIDSQKTIEETLKDNSELKAAQGELELKQQQLVRKIEELHESNKSLEEFAFIASHDLQEPLRKIRTFTHLLEREMDMNEKQAGLFSRIKNASERMSNLITDVLNYSQVSSFKKQFLPTDLNVVVKNVLEDIELLIEEKKAEINVENLPTITALPLQMTQLFSNLIQNSIKFSHESAVINIRSVKIDPEEILGINQLNIELSYTCIIFEDHGIGFDQQYSEKIFVIFQRLKEVDAAGTGIGLALCKKIVENHRGFIKAESVKGQGTTFKIYLPLN